MPADLILRESELQGFVERTVLSIQNARARLMGAEVPVDTDDFEITFSGVLIMDKGVSAFSREATTVAGGGKTRTKVEEPDQVTTVLNEPEESVEESNGTDIQDGTTQRTERATETSKKVSARSEDASESASNQDSSSQNYGRIQQTLTTYQE